MKARAKFFIAPIVAIAIVIGCIGVFPVEVEALEGAGTELDPFRITSEADLRMIADFPDACWRIENDISLTSTWSPVSKFRGVLDGNGYKVDGLIIRDSENSWPNEAAFINENTGTIRNFHLEGEIYYDSCHLGGAMFVMSNSGTIENCSVKGTMNLTLKNTHSQNNSQVGGFVSFNESTGVISDCYARIYINGVVSGGRDSYLYPTSCFVNENSGSVKNCYSASYGRYANDEYWGFKNRTEDSGTYQSCYYDKDLTGIYETSDEERYDVYPKTTAAMKMQFNYSGWDFGSVWAIDESVNDGYPYLQNEKSVVVGLTGLALDKTSVVIGEGEQTTLTPIFTPQNASNKDVSWTTSSRYVAEVNGGVVTGIAEGTAVITATSADGGHTASCTVVVEAEPQLDYTVNSVSGDVSGGGKFRAEVNFTKNTDISGGVVILGLYDSSGVLADYVFVDGDFDAGKTYTVGATLTAFEGASLKAFVWDSLDTMRPISNTAEADR